MSRDLSDQSKAVEHVDGSKEEHASDGGDWSLISASDSARVYLYKKRLMDLSA